jgi:chorismate-pyruvate lyase
VLIRLFAVICLTAAVSVAQAATSDTWSDTPVTRLKALALLQTLNADLLSHSSATLTLESWCAAHDLAPEAHLLARRVKDVDKVPTADQRRDLGVSDTEPVKYRRVQLYCGERLLSEADNWYIPSRLTAEMNRQLDETDISFGRVVQPLRFHRETQSAEILWSPLDKGWEMKAPGKAGNGPLEIPRHVLQHRAVLYTHDNVPFSEVIETYTNELFAFPLRGPAD